MKRKYMVKELRRQALRWVRNTKKLSRRQQKKGEKKDSRFTGEAWDKSTR